MVQIATPSYCTNTCFTQNSGFINHPPRPTLCSSSFQQQQLHLRIEIMFKTNKQWQDSRNSVTKKLKSMKRICIQILTESKSHIESEFTIQAYAREKKKGVRDEEPTEFDAPGDLISDPLLLRIRFCCCSSSCVVVDSIFLFLLGIFCLYECFLRIPLQSSIFLVKSSRLFCGVPLRRFLSVRFCWGLFGGCITC